MCARVQNDDVWLVQQWMEKHMGLLKSANSEQSQLPPIHILIIFRPWARTWSDIEVNSLVVGGMIVNCNADAREIEIVCGE